MSSNVPTKSDHSLYAGLFHALAQTQENYVRCYDTISGEAVLKAAASLLADTAMTNGVKLDGAIDAVLKAWPLEARHD